MIFLAFLLQAAPPTATTAPVTRASAASPQRFSILVDPCAQIGRDGRDVVVCGKDAATSRRLPYPDDIVPDHGVPSNPDRNGQGALAAAYTPCAARIGGCPSGVFPPIVPAAIAIVHGIQSANANRREAKARAADGSSRRPIDLAIGGPAGRLDP